MLKSDENGDQSSKETASEADQVSFENVISVDENADCSTRRASNETKDSLKPVDTTKNVVNEAAGTSSSRDVGTGRPSNDESKQCILLQKASEKLHCPFYWQEDIPINSYGNYEVDLLSDFEEMFEEMSFQFRRFIVHLVMCYHSFYKTLVPKSVELVKNLEKMLVRSARRESNDFLFNRIRDALYHVSHSCHVYIHEKMNQIEKAYKTMEKIKSYESMDAANKAAVWGIRAAVYAEYGHKGLKAAVAYTEKAVELDQANPFWHFYQGVYLGRLRRMQKGPKGPKAPTEAEIQCLQTALNLRKDPAFYTFIAETYLELVRSINVNDFPTKYQEILSQKMDKLCAKAVEYLEQSLSMKENCAHLLFRCGKGYMRLPPPYQNLKRAKDLIEKGLEISPKSTFGNHAMAMFKMEFEHDREAAERYLEKSKDRKNFQAHLDFCRLHYLEGKGTEFLIAELKTMLEIYEEIPKQCKLYGELICCFLFVQYDLVEACKCAERLLELQTEWIDYIYEFKSGLLPFSQAVAIFDILAAETGLRCQRKDIADAEKNVYKLFINLLLQQNVELHDMSKTIHQKYSDDLKRGLGKARQRMANKSCDHQTAQRHVEERNAPNNQHRSSHVPPKRSDNRDVPRSPLRGREQLHERRVRNERNASKNRQSGVQGDQRAQKATTALAVVDKAKGALQKSASGLPTNEISAAEKIEAFISNTRQKGVEIGYSVEAAENCVRDSKNRTDSRSQKNERSASADRQSVGSKRDEKVDRCHCSPSPGRESRSSRREKDAVAEKSSRGDKKNRRHSSRGSRSSRQSKDRRSPSVDRTSVKSRRGHETTSRRNTLTGSGTESRSARTKSDRRSPSADRQSVRSNRSRKRGERRRSSFSSPDRQSRSGRRENDSSPNADTHSVRSNRSNRKDHGSPHRARKTRTDRSPCSVASSRRNRHRRSSSASGSRSRSPERKSNRSVRSHRRRSSSAESGYERRHRRNRSDSSDRSRRSGVRRDDKRNSRHRRSDESDSSSSRRSGVSSRHSSKLDRRSGSNKRDDGSRRHRRHRSSSSSGDRSRRSYRSKGSHVRHSSDERHSSRRRSRRERSCDRSGSKSSGSHSLAHSQVSKRN